MRYSEVLDRLQNLTNRKISQAELCRILDIKQSAMGNRQNRDSNFSDKELSTLENHYNVILAKSDFLLDYYPDVFGSCGNGVFQFSTKKEQIAVPKNAIFKKFTPNKQYFVINAYGQSMEPLLMDHDKLIIESYDGEQIIDNRPYVFAYKDEIFIKKLVKNVDQLMIIPENKDYDVRKLTGEQLKDVNIIGMVVGLMRDLR